MARALAALAELEERQAQERAEREKLHMLFEGPPATPKVQRFPQRILLIPSDPFRCRCPEPQKLALDPF